MKILIYGVGGIGSFIGSFLKRTNFDLTFIARGMRFQSLKSNGLSLSSSLGDLYSKDIKIKTTLEVGEKYDVIVNTVKLYDFDYVLGEIKTKISGNYILLPFQNGIYAEEKIKEKIGLDRTYGAVAQISVYLDHNQLVRHVGRLATFFVGSYEMKKKLKLIKFCKECQKVGLDIRYKENIKEKIWEKFIFLSAYSGITTLTKKTIGEIFEDKMLKEKFILAMNETYILSKSFNVHFDNDPVEFWLSKIEKMPYDMTSSMFLDYKKKKKLELDWLSGFIVFNSKKKKTKAVVHQEIVEKICSAK